VFKLITQKRSTQKIEPLQILAIGIVYLDNLRWVGRSSNARFRSSPLEAPPHCLRRFQQRLNGQRSNTLSLRVEGSLFCFAVGLAAAAMADEARPLLASSRTGHHHVTPLEVASAVATLSARRVRRRTTLLSGRPPASAPMGVSSSFLFLSNLITGPGMLGLPAAFRFGGSAVAVRSQLALA